MGWKCRHPSPLRDTARWQHRARFGRVPATPRFRSRARRLRVAVMAAPLRVGADQRRAAVDRKRLAGNPAGLVAREERHRSEEHTSELQSLMRISYAVFCLKKKTERQLRS